MKWMASTPEVAAATKPISTRRISGFSPASPVRSLRASHRPAPATTGVAHQEAEPGPQPLGSDLRRDLRRLLTPERLMPGTRATTWGDGRSERAAEGHLLHLAHLAAPAVRKPEDRRADAEHGCDTSRLANPRTRSCR